MVYNTDTVPEVPLALVSNPYFEGKIAQMRNRPVPWEVSTNTIHSTVYAIAPVHA